jgi:hypothetical protein
MSRQKGNKRRRSTVREPAEIEKIEPPHSLDNFTCFGRVDKGPADHKHVVSLLDPQRRRLGSRDVPSQSGDLAPELIALVFLGNGDLFKQALQDLEI